MEPVKIGINGAGRIGALTYRALHPYIESKIVEVSFINDVNKNANPEAVARYIKRDSVHGKFQPNVEYAENKILIDGAGIDILHIAHPKEINCKDRGVRIVLEATGAFTSAESQRGGYIDHLNSGADYVVISAPVKDDIAKTVVLGVNYEKLLLDKYHAISNASCTTNCLAPIVKVLNNMFGIIAGDMITIHSYTNDQSLIDTYHSDARRARAANNIIPSSTGAAKAIGLIFPELKEKISSNAIAYRVPVPDGSVVDFNVKLKNNASPKEVNEALKKASESELEGILQYETDPLVSSDIIGSKYSSIVDSSLTSPASDNRIRIVSWYDNEWGYSNRTAELIVKIAKHLNDST